jgi:uncharacterized membrane protein
MDGLLVLLALVALAIPVSIIALIVGHGHLRSRLRALESQVARQDLALQALAAGAPMAGPVDAVPPSPAPAAPPQPEPAKLTPWDRATGAVALVTPAEPNAPVELVDASVSTEPAEPALPRPPSALSRFAGWLRENWVYAVSAASLALAGVFFVQYGIEKGLLPPELRVLAGVAFGLCLVAVGEWLRRRGGDEGDTTTAYLPSVFAGAGLVSVFAAVLAARQMYGLIGPQTAFAGHLVTAALAVGLGWFYGPLLVAVGLLGAAAAPFIVAGGSDPAAWLYGYFALIAAVGLAVDAVRRWAWVSALALVLGYGGGWLMLQGGAGVAGWVACLLVLAVLAVSLPFFTLLPRHDAPSVVQAARANTRPGVAVMLAAAAALASTVGLVVLAGAAPAEAMLALGGLLALALGYLLWAEKADGLADLGFVPALGLLLALMQQGLAHLPLQQEFAAAAARGPEVAAPITISLLLGMAVLISAAFALRSRQAGPWALAYGLAAVLVAPVAAAILELCWAPSPVIGAYTWALQVIALAAAMVALAQHYARLDGDDKRRLAYATLSALSLIALALFLLTTKTALTLALAVLALVAAGLDRRFKLPEMGIFLQIAAAVLGYRLLADPGIDWAMAAPLGQVILAFAGVIAALIAALWLLAPLDRVLPKGVLESAAAGLAAILANILIIRWLLPSDAPVDVETHWSASLNALPWLVLMLMQIYRARLGGMLRRLRQAIALLAGLTAGAALAAAVGPFNPLLGYAPEDTAMLVRGPLGLDTLALAYAVPGLILLLAAGKMPGVSRRLRWGFAATGAGLVALYLGLEIRRFWQGDWLGIPGVVQGELYSYTVALMLLGAGLLYQAIARRSNLMRRLAMAVIALTIAKVFLLDAAGLTGLTRVVSFLGLGLSLAGLAWLNRWAGTVSAQGRDI